MAKHGTFFPLTACTTRYRKEEKKLKEKKLVENQTYMKDNFLAICCRNCIFLEGRFLLAA